jgi:DNA modification methylase
MVGSGTVALVANRLGRKAFALDVDPLALLMVRVASRRYHADTIWSATAMVLAQAFAYSRNKAWLDRLFDDRFDEETKLFIRYWFPTRSRRHLLALWLAIENVKTRRVRDLLALAFSRTIIAKTAGASFATDLPHTRPRKRADKKVPDPLYVFARRVGELLQRLSGFDSEITMRASSIQAGDARKLPYQRQSIDLVVTSSPYANAIDYVRAHKFSLVWMGYSVAEMAQLRANMIGAERGERSIRQDLEWLEPLLPPTSGKVNRRRAILRRYFYDLDRVLQQIHRVLKNTGACAFIVGRSVLGNEIIDTPQLLAQIAKRRGFKHIGTRIRSINPRRRSLPFPSSQCNALNKRMLQEAIVGLAKT